VHVALVFEHTGLGRCLEHALDLVKPEGKFSVVLQLPGDSVARVSPTRHLTMQTLRDSFLEIDAPEFRRKLAEKRFPLIHQEQRSLPDGKAFWFGIFARK